MELSYRSPKGFLRPTRHYWRNLLPERKEVSNRIVIAPASEILVALMENLRRLLYLLDLCKVRSSVDELVASQLLEEFGDIGPTPLVSSADPFGFIYPR